ncbi:MFS transporter [Winogradskyella eckloniae]|uniref:MFS transporter n=1 Tax=Winogradskyella eckloniae TaxID=1089306 RepID=UPI0015656505|nr:MFS transporter [Winogradskyella eckloniae]NRD19472.1 MFS transporter [Winogradskyella eckloniae]
MKKVSNIGIFTLLLVSSLTIMVGSVIAPALTGIVKHTNFGFSPSWLITLPSLGVVVFAPFVGRLINKLGTFNLLVLSLAPYAILGVLGAFIANDYILILNRFFLGVVTVGIQVSVTAYIAEFFTGDVRMKMIAWQGMAIELGGVVFLGIGGVLGELHWQYPFYVYAVALLCLVLVVKTLPKPTAKKLEKSTTIEATNANKIKVQLIFFASLFAMMLFFVGFVTLPLYLPETFGFSESQTGYLMAFISVVAVLSASQMPKVVKQLSDRKTVALGFLFFMLSYIVLAMAGTVPMLVLMAIFMGIGFGFTIPLLNHMMIEVSTIQNQGKNLGLYSMGVFGGQFLSTFIEYISDNYIVVYSVSAVLAVGIGAVILYMFKKFS